MNAVTYSYGWVSHCIVIIHVFLGCIVKTRTGPDRTGNQTEVNSTVRGHAWYCERPNTARVIQFSLLIGCNNSSFYIVKVPFSSSVDSYTCTQPELYFGCYSK